MSAREPRCRCFSTHCDVSMAECEQKIKQNPEKPLDLVQTVPPQTYSSSSQSQSYSNVAFVVVTRQSPFGSSVLRVTIGRGWAGGETVVSCPGTRPTLLERTGKINPVRLKFKRKLIIFLILSNVFFVQDVFLYY